MPHYNYYINVRVGTVFLLSVLIDDKIGEPITAGYLTVRGLKQLVVKIDEDSGIKCILLELLRLPNKMGKEDILMDFKGECCNNNLKCHYRDENRCKCTNNDVKNIMERLVNIGILIKKDGLYYYDPLGTI
jgi:hypothetical protein